MTRYRTCCCCLLPLLLPLSLPLLQPGILLLLILATLYDQGPGGGDRDYPAWEIGHDREALPPVNGGRPELLEQASAGADPQVIFREMGISQIVETHIRGDPRKTEIPLNHKGCRQAKVRT